MRYLLIRYEALKAFPATDEALMMDGLDLSPSIVTSLNIDFSTLGASSETCELSFHSCL